MSDHLKRSRGRVPDPNNPNFFAKYLVPDELAAWAWGLGASTSPRVIATAFEPDADEQ